MRRALALVALVACAPTTIAHKQATGGVPDARDSKVIIIADAKVIAADIVDAKGSNAMAGGFDKARGAFRDYAALGLGLAADKLTVSPVEVDPSVQLHQKVNGAYAFVAWSLEKRGEEVRGWATDDATVITPDRNLGRLFVEAGAWAPGGSFDAAALTEKIVWAMGSLNRLLSGPALSFAKGAGTLQFQIGTTPPAPGRPGNEQRTDCTVTLSADHQARLSRTPAKPPAPDPLIDQLMP